MRVLHLTSTFPRMNGDPTGPFLADLVAAERAAGLDVRVLAPHAAGLDLAGEVAGVPVRRFRYGPAGTEVLAYRGGLLAAAHRPGGAAMVGPYLAAMVTATTHEVRRWRPDLVHAHWWLPGGLAAAVVGRVTGCPFVVTLHGSDVALAARPGVGAAARRVLRRAAAVVAVSDALAAEARRVTGLSSIGVAAMPVDIAAPHRSAIPVRGDADMGEWPSQPGPVRLVAVGRLVTEKGFDVLIDALVVAGTPGLSLDIVGEGPLAEDLARRAAGLGGAVRFRGALARDRYHAMLRAADALVAPSRREGLGLAAVEAVLVGTPVIASHTGGLPEVLGAPDAPVPPPGGVQQVPGGLLVRTGDVAALGAALARVPNLPPPGAEAVARAARHSPVAVAERHTQLYRSVLERGRAGAGR